MTHAAPCLDCSICDAATLGFCECFVAPICMLCCSLPCSASFPVAHAATANLHDLWAVF